MIPLSQGHRSGDGIGAPILRAQAYKTIHQLIRLHAWSFLHRSEASKCVLPSRAEWYAWFGVERRRRATACNKRQAGHAAIANIAAACPGALVFS